MQIVLVVEDEPDIRALATEMLEEVGHVVVDFSTAAQAKAYCDVPQNDIAAVVTDINMPGEESGLDLATHIAATRPGTAVVVTSGRHDALPAGTPARIRFLPKPWTADMLLKAIGVPAP
jgi:two-component system, response regulator PdtaR